jgi:hypothetical protein
MKSILSAARFLVCVIFLILPLAAQKDSEMTHHATGTFDVRVAPLDPAFKFDDNAITRFSIDKQFHGDLDAASKGEMLAGGNPTKGSGGYVAIERVSGTIDNHTGTFLLQHKGTMQSSVYHIDVIVVPGSGTGQLTGIDGSMQIVIKDGKHSYDFAYTLPAGK